MPTAARVAGRADAAHTTLRNVNGRAGQRPARQFVPMATQTDFSPPRASVTPEADLILVIDDEPQIRRAVRDALRDVTAKVDEAANGADGVNAATSARPDLVVLDLGLPDMAGVDVCREIRRRSAVPIIVLSARHSEHEKVDLLNAGADDYVTKPFSVLELAARAKAQIRRAKTFAAATSTAPIVIGSLVVDTINRRVSRDDTPIHLTPIEWQILATLLERRGTNADAPADLRRGVGPRVRKSAAVSSRAHHQLATKDRSRSGDAADHHHRARRGLPGRAAALNVSSPQRQALRWALAVVVTTAVTATMVHYRGDFDQVHVVLMYLLIVLFASASSGRALGITLACTAVVLIDYYFQPPYGQVVSRQAARLVGAVRVSRDGDRVHEPARRARARRRRRRVAARWKWSRSRGSDPRR